MKIAILGTRGIPNNYGGFEQFAERLSTGLVSKGHHVTVYTPHDHPYKGEYFGSVNLIRMRNPESGMGTAGMFLYDLFCINDCRRRNFDIIYQLGYTSSSVWGWFLPEHPIVVTNMDGFEWKRKKYNRLVRRFLKYAEKLAVRTSDHLIADSLTVQQYLQNKYNCKVNYYPYGSNIISKIDPSYLERFSLAPRSYNMLVARLEPENSVEMILEGVKNSVSSRIFLVVGDNTSGFAHHLVSKFAKEKRIVFLGAQYDIDMLDNLRYFANLYFHGHTVGGTNPALLEAMGSGACICAFRNEFNSSILGQNAFYFENENEVSRLLDNTVIENKRDFWRKNNTEKIRQQYLWSKIVDDYEEFFQKIVADSGGRSVIRN
jgi:glycosyltransferase involved in cell wall biosynthesis